VDTPAYRLAANYSGWKAGPTIPLATPEKIAREVVRSAERPRPEVVVGNSVRTLELVHALAPMLAEKAVARSVKKGFLRDEPQEPAPGNLFEPSPGWSCTNGGFNAEGKGQAFLRARRAAAAGASVLGAGLLAWLLSRNEKTRERG
jgi:hypothetical protein